MLSTNNYTSILAAITLIFTLTSCSEVAQPGTYPIEERGEEIRFLVTANPADEVGKEGYRCFRLDAARLGGRPVRSVRWEPPQGSVIVHHATLFASTDPGPPGAIPCLGTEGASAVLHVYTPGAVPLALPPGVAMALPEDTRRLILEIHALRIDEGPAGSLGVILETEEAPEHLATWVDVRAPVPEIDPHGSAVASARCRFARPVHLVSTWPHMHQAGSSFLGQIVREWGTTEELILVDPWDFEHQPLYPRDVVLNAGDAVRTTCAWKNPTSQPVLPGALTSDEMCNQGVIVWPREDAKCQFIPE